MSERGQPPYPPEQGRRMGGKGLTPFRTALSSPRKGARVAKQKKAILRVQIDGKRRYISVPAGRALDLHSYLRSNRVRAAPPEPAYTGFDTIDLETNVDVDSVQALLNSWDKD